ncbi:hypothetical protein MUK42_25829 [Musa troglodytarum]|uniref:Uncharacterized protein n=1 Tax=Musa troglodytarum TaxID=320322 RepID=A0A9E7JBZ3_9LILI|nr:hypothetical protein MUK42_25829 [Musa troglodytarum]
MYSCLLCSCSRVQLCAVGILVSTSLVLSSPHANLEATTTEMDPSIDPHLLQPGRVGNDVEASAPLDLRLQTRHFVQHIKLFSMAMADRAHVRLHEQVHKSIAFEQRQGPRRVTAAAPTPLVRSPVSLTLSHRTPVLYGGGIRGAVFSAVSGPARGAEKADALRAACGKARRAMMAVE